MTVLAELPEPWRRPILDLGTETRERTLARLSTAEVRSVAWLLLAMLKPSRFLEPALVPDTNWMRFLLRRNAMPYMAWSLAVVVEAWVIDEMAVAALFSRSMVQKPRLLSVVVPKTRRSLVLEADLNCIAWTAKDSFLLVSGKRTEPESVLTVTRVPATVVDWSWVVNMTKRLFWYAEVVETEVWMSAVESRESTLQLTELATRVKRTIWSCLPRELLS
mmetsp:Transcript_31140/g.68664  ORF Transcript_31140/g.68664 Transcript_31140/m.68664 type:complete len:219 (+) Transcript_31140:2584-3240(+)